VNGVSRWLICVGLGLAMPAWADAFDALGGSGQVGRHQLTADQLLDRAAFANPLSDFSAYALPADAAHPRQVFRGRLTLKDIGILGGFNLVVDRHHYMDADRGARKQLPPFDFQFIQTGSHIFPLARGSVASIHPVWEFVLSPGRVWDERGDQGYSRVAMPFALQQKNANCIHNGVLSFLFKDDGSVSRVAYQIASETCPYFKFDLSGMLAASYTPQPIADAQALTAAYQAEVGHRMPTRPLAALATDYPDRSIDVRAIAAPSGVNADHISAAGLVIDGVHYTSACPTRQGDYPFCSGLVLPSFSVAKSAFAGVAMMRLEQKYPGTRQQAIARHVPECERAGWGPITLDHTLDMATGRYDTAEYLVDEGNTAITSRFFLKTSHADKIEFGCAGYARQGDPGSTWVYHTSDTYVAGTMMQNYYRGLEGSAKDLYTDLVVGELWQPLKTSATSRYSRRTADARAQPFAGWGLILLPDDVAKIGAFIGIARGAISGTQLLDPGELDAALQRRPADRGVTPMPGFRYHHGFWALNLKSALGCASDTFVPFMSGFGGISVVLMPNDTVYYQFSDDDTHAWLDAAIQSHKIRALCH
jgi:hypothetical protein